MMCVLAGCASAIGVDGGSDAPQDTGRDVASIADTIWGDYSCVGCAFAPPLLVRVSGQLGGAVATITLLGSVDGAYALSGCSFAAAITDHGARFEPAVPRYCSGGGTPNVLEITAAELVVSAYPSSLVPVPYLTLNGDTFRLSR